MGIHGFKVTNNEEIRKQLLAQLDEMEELARDLQAAVAQCKRRDEEDEVR